MANKTLSDFPVLTNLDAASVTHVQKELVDYQVPLSTLTQYVTENAEYATLGDKIDGADEKTDPVDADMVGLMDSAASNVLKKFSWANFKAKLKTYFDALYPSVNGWVSLGLTMTYVSADAPTFTATVPGDVTGVLSAGMKLKLTQTTVKYFIITAAPSYSSGTGLTTLTFYGGTDYTLVNAAISNLCYSPMKAPHGFPLDPAKWTVEVGPTNAYYNSPGQNVMVNLSSMSISVPIGCWKLSLSGSVAVEGSASGDGQIGLHTSVATPDTNYQRYFYANTSVANNYFPCYFENIISRVVKTPYYLVGKTTSTGVTALRLNYAIIRAVSAYL